MRSADMALACKFNRKKAIDRLVDDWLDAMRSDSEWHEDVLRNGMKGFKDWTDEELFEEFRARFDEDPPGCIGDVIPTLFCSTAHVPKPLAMRMNEGEDVPGLSYYNIEHGWFLWVPGEDNDNVANEPTELKPLLDACRAAGVEYIRFDSDAPINDNLPHWEW
jgi:hypothetical protein